MRYAQSEVNPKKWHVLLDQGEELLVAFANREGLVVCDTRGEDPKVTTCGDGYMDCDGPAITTHYTRPIVQAE